jgi:DNA-directed RNA polymerase subunit M/transcription elongation factor TFIIS
MSDIFDNIVYCKNCNKRMVPDKIDRCGFVLRVLKCDRCKNQIIHPEDLKEYEDFQNLKKKKFKVKLRFIGNSYAVSIPREIIDFMNEQEKQLSEMVNLSLEEFGRISLNF